MEDPVRHHHGHDVPAGAGTAVGMGSIHQHTDLRLSQLLFAVDQVSRTIFARIGVEPEEPREAVFFEEARVESKGGRDTTDGVARPRRRLPHLEQTGCPFVGLLLCHYWTSGRSSTKDAMAKSRYGCTNSSRGSGTSSR